MTAFLALTLVLTAPASPIPGVPFPPGGEIDPVFTQVFTDRAADLKDGIKGGAIQADAAAVAKAVGQRGRSARWNRADGALEIDVEDHLIDPRTGAILARTVVLVTSLAD